MKKKDIVLVVLVAVLIVGGSFLSVRNPKPLTEEEQREMWSDLLATTEIKKGVNDIDFNYFKAAFNLKEEKTIIYLGSSSCGWCSKYSPVLDEVAKENNLKTLYINLANLKDAQYSELAEMTEGHFSGGTPTTLVVENGEITYSFSGYKEKADLINLLKEAEVIG